MKNPRLYLIILPFISMVSIGASAQTTWTGATSTDWFTASNWSSGVPTTSTAATIPSGPGNQPVVMYFGAYCKTLTISSGAALSITGGTLSVFGALSNSGTLTFTTGTLQLTGNFNNSGTLNKGTGSVLFFGAGSKTLLLNGASLHSLTVSGGTVYPQSALSVTNLAVNASSSMNIGSYSVTISQNCDISGSLTGTGLIIFTGTGSFSTGASAVPRVQVTGGTRIITVAIISQDLTLIGGTTRINQATVSVLGNLTQQAGATMEVNSPGFLDISGQATLSGPFTMPAGTILCRGNWTSGPAFKPAGGTVQFSNGASTINATGSVFHNLEFIPLGPKTLQAALDVNGKMTVRSGATVNIGAFTHKVAGGLVMNGTLSGTGLFELDGTGVFTATPNAVAKMEVTAGSVTVTSAARIASSLHVKGGSLRATTGTLTVDGPFTVESPASAGTDSNGIFDLNGIVTWNGTCSSVNGRIKAASTWTSGASFQPSGGVVELDGGSAMFTNSGSFHDLHISGGTKTATGALDVNGGLETEAGSTLALGTFTHTIARGLDVEGTLAGTGGLILDGPGDIRVTTSAPDVTVTGGPVTVNTVANLGGFFRVASTGTFAMTTGTLTVQGDVTLDSPATLTGGTIDLAGGAATVSCSGSKLADLTVSGGVKTLSSAVTVTKKLTIAAAGSLALGTFDHNVGGGLDVAGTLTGTGLIDLDGPGALRALTVVPKLRVSSGPITVGDTARVGTGLEVTGTGRVDISTGGDLRVTGDVLWAGSCRSTGGTLRCSKDFTATGTGFAPIGGTVMLDGAGSGALDAPQAVFQTLEISDGTKTVSTGTVAFDKEFRISGGTLTTAGGVQLSPGASAICRVNAGATFRLHGDSWRNPVVAAIRSSGRWSFEVQGTLGLRYFEIKDLDTYGIQITGGQFENDALLGNGIFDSGAPGGTFIRFAAFTQTRTLRNVYFRTNPGTGANNVRYTTASGKVIFENAIGVFKGQTFESDPNNRVDWTLGPTSALKLSEVYQDSPLGVEVAATDTPVDLDGRILAFGKEGGSTGTFVLPARVLELDEYLELREGTGTNGPGLVFLGGTLPWSIKGGGFAALQNASNQGGIDFVRWGGSTRSPPAGTQFTDSRGSLPAPEAGQSLGRDMDLTDTDTREDWEPGSGKHANHPTRGARNILFGVPYLWEGGEEPNPFTVVSPGAANLWHLDTKRFFNPNSRKHEAGPPPDRKAWTFNTGSPAYTFQTGSRVQGVLRSPPVRLPDVLDLRLGYFEWLQTENVASKDQCILEIRELGTSTWTTLAKYTGIVSAFTERKEDLSTWKGKDVEVQWTFDSVDGNANGFEGWYVDFITVYRTSQGHPLFAPGKNGPPPPPPVQPPPVGDGIPAWDGVPGGPVWFGHPGQKPSVRLALAGPNALGLEVKTGLFAVRKMAGETPCTWKDVVVLQDIPSELAGFIKGEPYPEIRLPLPVLPGVTYHVAAVQTQSNLLPSSGMPGPPPGGAPVEILPPTAAAGPVLVIRPFGLDAEQMPVQRHTVRFLVFWEIR